MTAAIDAHDVFASYRTPRGDVTALRGLTLCVAEEETVAVLGPSGAGKSTLLAVCTGTMRRASGNLAVAGMDPSASLSRFRELARQRIGLVRQHYDRALPRELTIEETVALPLRMLGRRDRHSLQAVDRLLAKAGLRHRARAKPHELSGGEQQRVAICTAIIKRPRLVLADEPTGELDPRTSEIVVDLLLELAHDAAATLLIVTHDPQLTSRTARTIHLRDGRLSAEGTEDPYLVVDEHGWLRLPASVREQARIARQVKASVRGRVIELRSHNAPAPSARQAVIPRGSPASRLVGVAVRLEGIRKTQGTGGAAQHLFQDFSHVFALGGFHIVAGPSGSGKTTLLGLIGGLTRPDAGAVWVGQTRIDALTGEQIARWRSRHLGWLSQHTTLVEFLTARENIELGLTLRSQVPERNRVDSLISQMGLEEVGQRRADRLAGGEQRRVALARAVVGDPEVVLVDEPTAHLDRAAGRWVVHLLRTLVSDRGATVIAATHDPEVASAADTVLELAARATHTVPVVAAPHERDDRRR